MLVFLAGEPILTRKNKNSNLVTHNYQIFFNYYPCFILLFYLDKQNVTLQKPTTQCIFMHDEAKKCRNRKERTRKRVEEKCELIKKAIRFV